MKMQVNVGELNFRSRPDLEPAGVVAKLRRGDIVHVIDRQSRNGFLHVTASVNDSETKGFVWEAFLAPLPGEPEPVLLPSAVHLEPRAKRAHDYGHPYPLSEPPEPRRAGPHGNRPQSVLDVIRWLAVEKHKRYLPTPTTTYCNVYAYDFCYLTGAYLPRVWWTEASLRKLRAGASVRADLVSMGTVVELSANGLHQWLVEWGHAFGWTAVAELDDLQNVANCGGIAIICGRNRSNGSGHISIVAPESPGHEAVRKDGRVVLPMQSQAGSTNVEYGHFRAWWTGTEFSGAYGFWAAD